MAEVTTENVKTHTIKRPMPERIQLRRTRGWRKPPGAVVVSRPGKWGNPLRWSDYPPVRQTEESGLQIVPVAARRRWAVTDFAAAVKYGISRLDYPSVEEIRRELAGKDLACWCPLPAEGEPDDCHAAILIEIANEPADWCMDCGRHACVCVEPHMPKITDVPVPGGLL